MDFLEKNINAIKVNRALKGLDLIILDDSLSEDTSIAPGSEEIAGRQILYVVQGEKLWQLDSMYNTEGVIASWKAGIQKHFRARFLIFGLGNGMFIRELLKEADQSHLFLVYEPSITMLRYVIKNFDLTDILADQRVKIVVQSENQKNSSLYSDICLMLDYVDLEGMQQLYYPNYKLIFPEEYKFFEENCTSAFSALKSDRSVLVRFGYYFASNTFLNAAAYAFSSSLSDLWTYMPTDIPAIVVSSGPSLTNVLEDLKKAKGKAFIMAVDSALNVLLNHDIIPDVYLCCDARKNKKNFANEKVKDIPYIGTIQSSYHALVGHRAPQFFYDDVNPIINGFNDANEVFFPSISTGGSVANDATGVANFLGFKTIIFVGQDLAYTNNESHASGSVRAGMDISQQKTLCYVEGMDGKDILSSLEFRMYRNWFEREIEKNPGIHYINATGAGARIHGADEMPFSEALTKYCTKAVDYFAVFRKARPLLTEEKRQALYTFLQESIGGMDDLDRKVIKAKQLYDKMMQMVLERNYNNGQFKKMYEETSRISQELQEAAYTFFAEMMVQEETGDHMKGIYDVQDDMREELRQGIQKAIDYMDILHKGFGIAKENLEKPCSRLEELFAEMRSYAEYHFEDASDELAWEEAELLLDAQLDGGKFIRQLHLAAERLQASAHKENVIESLMNAIDDSKPGMVLQHLGLLSACIGAGGNFETFYPRMCAEKDKTSDYSENIRRMIECWIDSINPVDADEMLERFLSLMYDVQTSYDSSEE